MYSNHLYFIPAVMIFVFSFTILQIFAQEMNGDDNEINSQKLSTYENNPYGFEIKYPSNMEIIEENFLTSSYQQILNLFLEEKYKVPILSIAVYFPFPNENSLDDFLPRIIKEISNPKFENVNKTITILKNESSTLGLQPAHKIEYYSDITIKSNNKTQTVETKNLDIWSYINDIIYEVEYSGSEEKYDEYLSSAEKIIDSFRVQ
ncbi:MAG: hypothetical protein ACPKQO_02165 [Nitrososphaeraceae archaeon]